MAGAAFDGIEMRMTDEPEELRRVKAWIADLERRIAHEDAAVAGSAIGSRDRTELLRMLMTTLAAMKAREARFEANKGAHP
jgi:hypothetical protein